MPISHDYLKYGILKQLFTVWAKTGLLLLTLIHKRSQQTWHRHCCFCCRQSTSNQLTHWGRDKMDAISQTTFSNAFSWLKMFEIQLKFHWSLFLWVQLTTLFSWDPSPVCEIGREITTQWAIIWTLQCSKNVRISCVRQLYMLHRLDYSKECFGYRVLQWNLCGKSFMWWVCNIIAPCFGPGFRVPEWEVAPRIVQFYGYMPDFRAGGCIPNAYMSHSAWMS